MLAIDESRKEVFKRFTRFLKENKVYYRYFSILKKCPTGDFQHFYKGNIEYFFNNCGYYDWLNSCFIWTMYSGYANWSDLCVKWRKDYSFLE